MDKNISKRIIWGEDKITQRAWDDEKIERIKLITLLLIGIVFLIIGVINYFDNIFIGMVFFVIMGTLLLLNAIRMYINYKKPKFNDNII
jgi:hypothetical protein